MRYLLTILTLIVIAPQSAIAMTWYLVVVADGKGGSDTEYVFTLPMESEMQCEIAGSKLELSAKQGKFDQKGTDYMAYECVKGK